MTYEVRETADGRFVVDDGETVLTRCPCCDKDFTRKAAEKFVEVVKLLPHNHSLRVVDAAFRATFLPPDRPL